MYDKTSMILYYKTTPLFYCGTYYLLYRLSLSEHYFVRHNVYFYCHILADERLTGTYEKTGTKLNNLYTYTSSENNMVMLHCYIMFL